MQGYPLRGAIFTSEYYMGYTQFMGIPYSLLHHLLWKLYNHLEPWSAVYVLQRL